MPVDFATETTLRSLSPLYQPLATESSIVLLTNEVIQIQDALAASDTQTRLHEFQENLAVPSGVETTVLSYTVPVGKTLWILGWEGWADVDAEWILKIDGVQKDGARTSIADVNVKKKDTFVPMIATQNQIVAIRVLRQSPTMSLPFKSVLKGVLNA